VVLKFVPVIDIAVPGVATTGVKLVIVGAPVFVVTVKFVVVVKFPDGVVTFIVPVVAPVGTVTMSWFTVADVIVAALPLKLTVSWLGVAL
jgi:hypothetical protein